MQPTLHHLARRAFILTVTLAAVALHAMGAASVSAAPIEEAKFVPSAAVMSEQYGTSVSVDGDTAVIGAHRELTAIGAPDSGAADVYIRVGNIWTLQAKLTASDSAHNWFGHSVSVDGDTAVIGAHNDNEAGVGSGAAYVFTRSGTTWTEQAKLTASDAGAGDWFGYSVSVSGDTVVVGAYKDGDSVAGPDGGSAYVFTRNGTAWTEQAALTASDAAQGDLFGRSVAVAGDTTVVGASLRDGTGSAYVFTRRGTVWVEHAILTASDAGVDDRFGASVAVSGNTTVIGAPVDDVFRGSAYVFTLSGRTWSEQAKLTASDAATDDWFGSSVAVDEDSAVIGAHLDDGAGVSTNSGSAYVFTRNGTAWSEQSKLTASDGAALDSFGTSVAVSGDTTVIGSPEDAGSPNFSGSAYVFRLDNDTDGDGQSDADEVACGSDPLDAGSLAPDYDGDTIPDCVDSDDDNDGVPDRFDDVPMSNLSETVVFGRCDSGVPNHLLPGGATFMDVIARCSLKGGSAGQYRRCVSQVTREWQADGLISGQQLGAIKRCAYSTYRR